MNHLFAGYADHNASLFRRIQVALGDPSVFVSIDGRDVAIVRDLEMDRVRQQLPDVEVLCPADLAPEGGLSADRETATAQAAAVLVRSRGVDSITADRSLPFVFAWHLQQSGIQVAYDADLGVLDRRAKTEQELEWLSESQAVTEQVMRQMCETIATAKVSADGFLLHDGELLSSERVRSMAAVSFLNLGYTMQHGAIVATAPEVADCHHSGTGKLRTEVPVIVDLFPQSMKSRYWGDCTRTVVHGQPSSEVIVMHQAVVSAKAACISKFKPGVTAEAAHRASEDVLKESGFPVSRGTLTDDPSIQHGTGHGIGLDLHEPILLDEGGGSMLCNEVFTVEPGLYGRLVGGVRIEDMVIVTSDGHRNVNRLHQGLDWRPS
ncbi:MAG: M24 family metallopeptidase [Planctomycetota bacterium]